MSGNMKRRHEGWNKRKEREGEKRKKDYVRWKEEEGLKEAKSEGEETVIRRREARREIMSNRL